MGGRYVEDFAVGETFGSGRLRVSGEQIKAFAAEFDPQPFDLNEEAADWQLERDRGSPAPSQCNRKNHARVGGGKALERRSRVMPRASILRRIYRRHFTRNPAAKQN
jgi:hypothetical protein